MTKVWFITGTSRGFGRIWAEAALARGDRVVATAIALRDVTDLSERFGDAVLPLEVDVTRRDQVSTAIARAHDRFGRLDVVLNNAGFSLVGAIEEGDEADVRAEFDVNVFGALSVIQCALPILRAQGSGHIIGVSSVAGVVAQGMMGFYHASKWAFEAIHEALAQEIAPFGIRVTMLEPGAYATTFATPASMRLTEVLPAYHAQRAALFASGTDMPMGDPLATPPALFALVDAEDPPLRFFVGTEGMPRVRAAFAERLETWERWQDLSVAAQGVSTILPGAG